MKAICFRWSELTKKRKSLGFDVKVQFAVREAYMEPMSSQIPEVTCQLFLDGRVKDRYYR